MTEKSGSQATEPLVVNTAAALMIGGELLSGKIRDENFYQLSLMLRARGVSLERAVFCPDERDQIAQDVRELSQAHDILFTSGGLGPTHDDVTIEAISQALGVPTVISEEMHALIRRHSGNEPEETTRLMARVPEGARLIQSPTATKERPGWPVIAAGNVWILPGVPELFRSKLAVVREAIIGPTPFFALRLYCRPSEVELKTELDRVVLGHPAVAIGSYPKWFDSRYKTLITFDGQVSEEVRAAAADLRTRLGEDAICVDFD